MTLRENTKNENSHQDLHSLTQRLPRKLSNSESLFRLVNKDYVRIINRLDKVATNQGLMTRRIDITDGRPMELILDQGEVQYFYITVKNKKCPLRIQLVKKGKLVTYMSKSTPEPSEELCEEEFNNDDFQISDPGIRFSCEHVFLAVKALEDAKYQIKAAFGRKKESPKKRSMSSTMVKSRTVKTLEQVRNDNELRHDLYYRVSLLIEKRRKNMYELSNHKDFVKLNLKIKDDREDLRSMTERRDRKHKEAGLRKQDIEESKKKIKMNLLNRHAIRQANLSSQRKLLEKRFQNIKTHKFWLSLLYLGKSIKKCIKIVKRNKNIKLKQNQVV